MRRHPKAALAVVVVLLCLLALPAAAAADTLPTVSGETASEVGVTTAKLSGEVNPNGTAGDGNTTWRLQYSPVGQEAWSTANEATIEPPASEEANPVPVEAVFGFSGELAPGETYEFRLQAENGAGVAETAAPYPTFTMDSATAPALVAEAASAVSITSAHLKGTVDPEGGNVNPFGPEVMPIFWELQVSTDGSSWTTAGSGEISGAEAEGTTPITVETDATGLVAATEYQVRLHAYSTNFGSFNVEADSPGPNPTFTTDPATAPTLTLAAPSAVTDSSAHLAGTVDPEGGNVDALQGTLPITWELQVQPEGGDWSTVGSGELTGAEAEGTAPVSVEADATGLVPNTEYKARLLATYAGVQEPSSEESFTTDAIASDVSLHTLWEPGPTSIQLNAMVNPHNAVLTDCHFEYGANGNLDQSAPCQSHFVDGTYVAPDGNVDALVSARLTGLSPATSYDFRLVVANSAGITEGPVQTFETAQGKQGQSCPNEAVRNDQGTAHLPECMAFEKVSPADKSNSDVAGDGGFTSLAAADGERFAFSSRGVFADNLGSGFAGQSQYLARRTSTGWATRSVLPTPSPAVTQSVEILSDILAIYSENLDAGLLWAYDLPEVSDDIPNRKNIYFEETETRALQAITKPSGQPVPFIKFAWEFNEPPGGVTPDGRHVLLSVQGLSMLPEAPKSAVYEWHDGALELISILPDGNKAPSAAVEPKYFRGAISDDGSRSMFTSPNSGQRQIYLRIDNERTVWVTEPEGNSAPAKGVQVSFQHMTPDGRDIFFATSSPLLDEDENEGFDIYRYTDGPEPASEPDNLTLISRSGTILPDYGAGEGGAGGAVIGASDDGERVYYQAGGLADHRIMVWDHGVTSSVSQIDSENAFRLGSTAFTSNGLAGNNARVSPDGRWLAFVTPDPGDALQEHSLTGKPVVPVAHPNERPYSDSTPTPSAQLYLYDLENATLRCASCVEQGESRYGARVHARVTNQLPIGQLLGGRVRFLADDGTVFFSSPRDPLVSRDVNGVADTYQYDPKVGVPELISTGTAAEPTMFADASADGSNVFLLSRSQLLTSDRDHLVDAYDARVGGGFVEPSEPNPGCAGADCGPPVTAAPGAPAIGSNQPSRGNLRHRKRKAKHCKPHRHGRRGCKHRSPKSQQRQKPQASKGGSK